MAFLDKIHPLLKRTRENKYSDSNYAVLNAIDKQLEEMELVEWYHKDGVGEIVDIECKFGQGNKPGASSMY